MKVSVRDPQRFVWKIAILHSRAAKVLNLLILLALVSLATSGRAAQIQVGNLQVELQRVININNTGILNGALDLAIPPDGSGRMFVAEKQGRIQLCTFSSCTTALDLRSEMYTSGANGLMGITFHPGFANPSSPGYRKLYTHHTVLPSTHPGATVDFPSPPLAAIDHHNVITEWQMSTSNPNVVDVSTRREVFRESHVGVLHNGGTLTWGPDGYLYGSIGTPALSTAQHLTAQDNSNLYGTIYRIDPIDPALTPSSPNPISANGKYRIPADNPFVNQAGLDEIFAYGLRHPYRFSVDRATGLVFVGDVGQGWIEEVSVAPPGGNLGWPYREGTTNWTIPTPNPPPTMINPIAEYTHEDGRSVIGGFVYRGSIRALRGKYIFGEFSWGTGGFVAHMGRMLWIDPFDSHGNLKPISQNVIQEMEMGPISCASTLNVNGACTLDITLFSIATDPQGEIYFIGTRGGGRQIVYKIVDAYFLVPEPANLGLLLVAFLPLALRRGWRTN